MKNKRTDQIAKLVGTNLKRMLDSHISPEKFNMSIFEVDNYAHKLYLNGNFSMNVCIMFDYYNPGVLEVELEQVYLVPYTHMGIGTSIIEVINNTLKGIPFMYSLCDTTETDRNGVSVWMHIFSKFEEVEVCFL